VPDADEQEGEEVGYAHADLAPATPHPGPH
jgi:hypothetical protein